MAKLVYFLDNEVPQEVIFHDSMVLAGGTKLDQQEKILSLPYEFLSEVQAYFIKDNGKWYFKNLNSKTLTAACGTFVPCNDKIELKKRSIIRIVGGLKMLTLMFLTTANDVPSKWVSLDLATAGDHFVRILDALDKDKPEEEQDYVTLKYEDGMWQIVEIHSEKIYINGVKITGPTSLRVDDVIRIDRSTFYFEGARLIYDIAKERNQELDIRIDERAVLHHFRKKLLLKDINLSIEPGNMVLVLGGSGAGKSTFINAVTGYEKADARITSGSLDFYKDYDKVKYKIGFVPQQDLMRGEDEVFSTVMNSADMRLARSVPENEKKQRVSDVLEMFGLKDLMHTQVSKLSGGQRKRLSICIEYVADPTLFVLDEPDSGLDGVMARELMHSLRRIADEDKIVLVITHTPDRVVDEFDRVIVLAKAGEDRIGQLVYYGKIKSALEFFGCNTMEDIVRLVNSKEEGGEGKAEFYIEKYNKHKEQSSVKQGDVMARSMPENTDSAEQKPEPDTNKGVLPPGHTGRFGQFKIYLGKLFRLFILERNWKVLIMAAIIAVIVAAVTGARMYRNMEDTQMGALAFACVCIWNGFFNSIQSVCKERSIIKREHRAGLYISSYLMAHVVYQACICAAQAAIAVLIYLIMGIKFPDYGCIFESVPVLEVGIILFIITFAADMLALMISCIARNTTVAMTVVPFLLMIQLIFSGIAFNLDPPADKVSNLTVAKWGADSICSVGHYNELPSYAIMDAIYAFRNDGGYGQRLWGEVIKSKEKQEQLLEYARVSQQIERFDDSSATIAKQWGILLGFSSLYVLIGGVALLFVDKDKR